MRGAVLVRRPVYQLLPHPTYRDQIITPTIIDRGIRSTADTHVAESFPPSRYVVW